MSEQQQPLTGAPAVQLGLFGGSPEQPIPDDVMESLNIVTGAHAEDGRMDFMMGNGEPKADPMTRLHPDFKGSKYEMLKKGDRTEKQIHFEDPVVKVIDIATDEGELAMSEILKLVGNPENGISMAETPPQIMLDPTTPRGYRAIVVVRHWKVRNIVKPVSAEAEAFAAGA